MDDKQYLQHLELLYKAHKRKYENMWNIKYPDIFHVNGLPIHFDTRAKKILIALSGGADSTMVTYMLCKLIEEQGFNAKISCFTMVRFWDEKPWLEPMAKDVFTYLKNTFPNIIDEHHWGFLPPQLEVVPLLKAGIVEDLPPTASCDVLCTVEYQKYLLKTKGYQYTYSGNTMNPPTNHSEAPQFRNIDKIKNDITFVISGPSINPFGLLHKNFTMAQYINYGLNDLLALTRSCEGSIVEFGEEYLHNNDYPPECGKCFFCEEKTWGFNNAEGYLLENL
jgi:hypothetical protein